MKSENIKIQLPYNIGRMTSSWMAFVGICGLLLLVGLIAIARQFTEGEGVTGMRDVGSMGGAAWGLYIVFGVYFIGVSFAGITVAALIRLLGLDYLKPISRLAEWLTVVALILGAFAIWADLGQPLRALTSMPQYLRPQSPFFGTFSLVIAGYLFASLVFLYLDGRRDSALLARVKSPLQWLHRLIAAGYKDTVAERARHKQVSFVLAVGIILLLLIAHTTLGLIFGIQVGRPGWFSALQGPSFVVLAGVSGLGLLIGLGAAGREVLDEKERINMAIFTWMGKVLLFLSLIYLYFIIAETVTNLYTGREAEVAVAEAILWGEYSAIFWLSLLALLGAIGLLTIQAVSGRWQLSWLVLAGLLVQVTAVGKRYLIVVPSQTHGTLLPYDVGSYAPTWVEYSVILGLIGLGGLLFALMLYFFPLVPLEGSRFEKELAAAEAAQGEEEKPPAGGEEQELKDEAPAALDSAEPATGGGA